MGKWSKIRIILRSLAAGATAVAAITPPGALTLVLIGVAAALGGASVDLPRDIWTKDRRLAKRNPGAALAFEDETPPEGTKKPKT